MPAITDHPEVVEQAASLFADLFSCQPQRRHFAEYLTGLMVAQRKTVLGIHREFVDISDQSCLNRFLTSAPWDVEALNLRRLELLQSRPETRYSQRGVIALDNTLIDRDGLLIADAGWFWDHAEERHKIAQDFIFANYVCTSGLHYPLNFRLFRKESDCRDLDQPFHNHTQLACQLIDWTCQQGIPGDFVFDCYFSSAEVLNYIHGKTDESGWPRGYVGDFKFNRNVVWKGQLIKLSDLAKTIDPKARKPISIEENKRQWYFTASVEIPRIGHRVRILILWNERNDASPKKILGSNRVTWEAQRIVGVYRKRWTGTETFHRDGKQELGMGDCQLRDHQGQTRHMHLVMLAYSLLINPVSRGGPQDWLFRKLKTIGEACRAVTSETMRRTIAWAIERIVDLKEPRASVLAKLGLT